MAVQKRRVSVPVKIGNVTVGGNHPIVVQSMTNTDTFRPDSGIVQAFNRDRKCRLPICWRLSPI
jgi:4-hydroxy-3-methylbut-2-en-1-yl diphosphate synthase IspG/GcpE